MPYRSGRYPYGRGIGSLGDQAAVDPSDWRVLQQILGAGGNPDDYLETAMRPDEGIMRMAKVYTNQDPGMVNRKKLWFDSLTPEAEAINKVLNMPGIEGMRQGSESDWNYDDYNKMIPDWLREQLPEEAFENLDDFRNQQRITT